jgi:hypothetical protein
MLRLFAAREISLGPRPLIVLLLLAATPHLALVLPVSKLLFFSHGFLLLLVGVFIMKE